MNVAVILAGGKGNRLGSDLPKQFLKLAGKTIIEHTIDVFERNTNIDEIAIVLESNYFGYFEDIQLKNNWKKVKKKLIGGKERYHSSLSAITAYRDNPKAKLIFHDAVRPLISHRIINETILALKDYDAVDVAIPSTDTIIKVEESLIQEIPSRKELFLGQTPQGFKLSTIEEAYRIGLKDKHFSPTDDCGIVSKYLPSTKIKVIQGDVLNIKITHKEDLYLADKFFQINSNIEIGQSINLKNLKDKVVVIFGGTSGIGAEIANICENNQAIVSRVSRGKHGIDIQNFNSIEQILKKTYQANGRIDYVINSAAILTTSPLKEMTKEEIDQNINTNYTGAVYIAKLSFKYLKKSEGQIVLFTSSSYTRGRAFYSIYSSSKAAIVNLTQALAEEYSHYNIRVNVINPERTKTPMRTKNFGVEPESTLLSAKAVAEATIQTMLGKSTGQIVDVKL